MVETHSRLIDDANRLVPFQGSYGKFRGLFLVAGKRRRTPPNHSHHYNLQEAAYTRTDRHGLSRETFGTVVSGSIGGGSRQRRAA